MNEDEKRETNRRKREGSRRGEQYVENTEEAKQARQETHDLPLNGYNDLNVEEVEKKAQGLSNEEIEHVLAYERQHENRKTLVTKLERRLRDDS